ncbi:hypothetical protein B0H12DRAFT_1072529 [Mycena haematopus]|nr:hypothetical protein B0H12DRAFT_1072529 [Mycena haematopus]
MNAERERLEGGDSRKRDGGGKKERHDVVTTSFVRNHVVISDQQSSRNCIAHVFPIHEHSRHIKYLPYNKRKAKLRLRTLLIGMGKLRGATRCYQATAKSYWAYWGTRLLPHLHSKNVFPDGALRTHLRDTGRSHDKCCGNLRATIESTKPSVTYGTRGTHRYLIRNADTYLQLTQSGGRAKDVR